ncbi:hypothetical protein GCM10010502_64770 [Kitasatospora aureofaciens]|uniref:Uncharacterized protein n=1 Tax=Kitasatospora aureofaciens TaxID=1894 RepID=A0A8H9I2Z9_KITAU|nr:hypothetical protein GCM10010502_64770 [Kitasatospora aureofaciens]
MFPYKVSESDPEAYPLGNSEWIKRKGGGAAVPQLTVAGRGLGKSVAGRPPVRDDHDVHGPAPARSARADVGSP